MRDRETGALLADEPQPVLDAAIDKVRDLIDPVRAYHERLLEAQFRYQQEGPVQVQLRGVINTDANGDNASLDLGGPTLERKWELRRLSVGGINWSTTVAGTAELYVMATDPLNTRNTADLVDQATSLPDLGLYDPDVVILRNPQRLWLVLVSPSASVTYAIGGAAIDRPDWNIGE